MTIKNFTRFERYIAAFLLPFVLQLVGVVPCNGQDKDADEGRVSNVRWTKKNDVIVINFDLLGSPDNKYEVEIAMKKDKDASFIFIPKNVDGHVGKGVVSGTNREIRWYYRTEYPLRIQDDECYFEIQVKRIEDESHLLYYIAGAAAAATAVVVILLSKNQQGGPVLDSTLPLPPGRP